MTEDTHPHLEQDVNQRSALGVASERKWRTSTGELHPKTDYNTDANNAKRNTAQPMQKHAAKDITEDAIIHWFEENWEATLVPYWKLKYPPHWEELKSAAKSVGSSEGHDLGVWQEDRRLQKHWEERARKLAATPNVTKNEIYNAIEGVKTKSNLVQLLKEQLKRVK